MNLLSTIPTMSHMIAASAILAEFNFNLSEIFHGIIVSTVFALVGVALLFLSTKLFDLFETKINFVEEIKNGNVAAGIVFGCICLAMGIIIAVCIM